jgi:hypothetical protein
VSEEAQEEGEEVSPAVVEPHEPTTALAKRTPAALVKAASFYPTGHADQRVLLSVIFGAPAGSAAVFAGGAALLGLGGFAIAALGILGTPFGLFGANWYYEHRGKSGLRNALLLFSHSPEKGRVALARIAGSRAWLPEVRLEAAGRLAVDALERGEVAEAIQFLQVGEPDGHLPRRRRSWEAGLRAEVLRSIFAWLAPDSFTDVGVSDSDGFQEPDDDAEGTSLIAALRILEAAAREDDARLAAACADAGATALATLLPTLHVIVAAVAAERLHHLADPLHQKLREDTEGKLRTLLRRLFPRMQILVDEGYRGVSQDLPSELEHTSLEIIAPAELTELAVAPAGSLQPVPRNTVAGAFMSVYGMFALSGLLLGMAMPMALAIFLGAYFGFLFGTPIAVVWGGSRVESLERGRRVAALRSLNPPPPMPWLIECATGPPGPVTRSSGYRRLGDIPPSQMVLLVAVVRAEQAIARGELDTAWAQVEWWFAGFSGQLPSRDPMYALGGSLIRIATLTGHLTQAERLSRVVPEMDNPWDEPRRRTAYGNSPRALALARALLAVTQAQWEHAADLIERASISRPVYLSPHDEALYAEVCRRLVEKGFPVRWTRWKVDQNWQDWLARVWPAG